MTGRRFLGLMAGLFALVVLFALTLVTAVVTVQAALAPTPATRMPVLLGILGGCALLWVVLLRWHRAARARVLASTEQAASGGCAAQPPEARGRAARG